MREVFEKIVEKLEEKANQNWLVLAERNGYKRSIEIVNQAATEYNNGWIPCSERLPEKKGKYLTTSKIYFVPDHVDEPDNYIGLEITYYSEINGWNGEVIAWQPLPAPYNQHICTNNDCTFNEGKDCPAAEGCAGYERKRTNFDRCRESMEAMAQIIDIAKIGWTKEQIMDWLQSEVEVDNFD